MKFALAKEHREFYAHNHFIEFEGILSKNETALLQQKVRELLTNRIKPKELAARTPQELYLAGHDLWREDKELQKIILKRSLAEIAAELFKDSPLRIGFDQYQAETFDLSLQQMSSLTPLIGAVALSLEDPENRRAIYFSPNTPLSFSFLQDPFLIVAYAGIKAQYILKKEDPHTHTNKRLGYAFGDLIKNDTHPIVFR